MGLERNFIESWDGWGFEETWALQFYGIKHIPGSKYEKENPNADMLCVDCTKCTVTFHTAVDDYTSIQNVYDIKSVETANVAA